MTEVGQRTATIHSGWTIPGAQSFELAGENDRGVLLIHGFGDTPQTLRYLAESLNRRGYTVRAPLLPGHGRTVEAFTSSTAQDWIDFAYAELQTFATRFPSVALGGLSMGGAIALLLAAEVRSVRALALIAPYLRMPRLMRFASHFHRIIDPFLPKVGACSPLSIRDPIEREKNLGYHVTNAKTLHELSKVVARARRAFSRTLVPALIVQSRGDNRIPTFVAEDAITRIGAEEKRLVLTDKGGHIITVDYGREQVFHEVRRWLDLYCLADVPGVPGSTSP